MNAKACLFKAAVLLLATSAPSAVRYVDAISPNPTPPYTTWASAAANIQDAIDIADSGDEIVVTNGVYQAGGRAVVGTMTNRVTVDKPLTVRSVNGPDVTVIRGYQVPGATNGDGAVRCVYLTNGAALLGFTLTNGATRIAGDSIERFGGGVFCASANSLVSNCVLTGNSALYGGGVSGGTLNNCTLSANVVHWQSGGGASGSILNNCTLEGNCAGYVGGGAGGGTLNNCVLTANSAGYGGGGASHAWLNNCTLTGNSGGGVGGGVYGSTLNNCIVYHNTAPFAGANNYNASSLNYCFTTPLPADGVGNLSSEPQLASLSHLSAISPCRGAGSVAYASGVDIDGETWLNPPSIGCDEVHPGAETGLVRVAIQTSFTKVATGFENRFTAKIHGNVSASKWEFGDGTIVSNRPYAMHTWLSPGDYPVVLRAYNGSYPGGMSATVTVQVVSQPVHYVAAESGNPVPPFASWATAANAIQDAVDAATLPGALVVVSNGVYHVGGRAGDGTVTNRVAVDRPLIVRSVNGPDVTMIDGAHEMRGVYLTDGATLSGFTLTNGATSESGGGIFCKSASAVVSNCVLSGNSAAFQGGGIYGGTVNKCILSGNFAYRAGISGFTAGGGAAYGTLNNCTLSDNSATEGGGAYGCTLNNCTLNGNQASSDCFRCEGPLGGGGAAYSTLSNCTLNENSAGSYGGGALGSLLSNCALFGNRAGFSGGGTYSGTLNNCTITGNSSGWFGGGATGGRLNNCIVYFNSATNGANYDDANEPSTLNYSCTTPLPTNGVGNFTDEPQLAGTSHLSAGSPCRGAGSSIYASGVDIDDEPWANPPSVGCDEPSAIGPLIVAILASVTDVAIGREVNFTALINGNVTASRWEFDDGSVVTNRPYATRTWQTAGVYPVVLRAYNQNHPAGVSATVTICVSVPKLTGVTKQSDGSVLLSGVGPANEGFRLWATEDLSLPLASWWVLTSGSFDSNGNFSFTDWDVFFDRSRFFRLSIP